LEVKKIGGEEMASQQSQANKMHWEAIAANAGQPTTPEAVIEYNEIHWPGLTAEPGGVDYIETGAEGVPAMWVAPKGAMDDRVTFYSHGGGFISGSIYTHRKLVGHLAKAVGCRALIYEFPYAHQAKHPAQLDTALRAYHWLLSQGLKSDHIAMAGDSAGAILTFGVLQRVREEGLSLPAAILIISGWMDMAQTAASYETNRDKDPMFSKAANAWLVSNIMGDGNRRDPLVSAVYADLKGFPPMFLQAGADEAIVDESRMLAERAKQAGVEVRLDIFPEMLHTFQMMAGRAPEADEAIRRLADWVRPKLDLDVNG
jgi:monoterpene epsilon-lactone hydrolase